MTLRRSTDGSCVSRPSGNRTHATWIAWPHHEPDWPGKLDADSLGVRGDRRARSTATSEWRYSAMTKRAGRGRGAICWRTEFATNYRLHVVPTDRVWLRDSGADGRHRRARRGCAGELAIHGLGEVPELRSAMRSSAPPSRTITGLPRDRAAPAGHRRARRARGRRDRDRRRRDDARDRRVPALADPGTKSRACRAKATSRSFATRSAFATRSGSAKAASATTRTATSTTSRGSPPPGVIVLAYEEDPADDENHRRSVDNYAPAPARRRRRVARCESSSCRIRGRSS